MSWESFGVVGFDLWSLLQGQTRIAKLKSAYNSLIIDPYFELQVPFLKAVPLTVLHFDIEVSL